MSERRREAGVDRAVWQPARRLMGPPGWLVAGLTLGLSLAGSTVRAQTQTPAPAVRRAEPVVVTATRDEEPLERIGASVTVIGADELELREYRTVEEALRSVPGVEVQRGGSPGKLTSLRIRGAGPTQVQVLIDGVRVKSTTSGDFDFADLTLDDVERIEVVRGPQSTLYGADAVGGVVNIITRRGRGRPSGFVDVEGGNYETLRERAGVSGALGPWRFSLGVSRTDFGGQFQNDEHRLTGGNARVGYALPNQGELAFVGRLSDGHRGIPFKTVFPDFDPNREQDDTLRLASLEWRQPWLAWYEHRIRLSAVWSDLTFRDPADPGESFGFRSDIASARKEAEWLHVFRLGAIDTVTLGLEYRREEGSVQGSYDQATDTRSVFLQNELRLFDRLSLIAGVRHDDNSAFGDETTARVALSYLVKASDTRVKASWAQGFRAPTFNELFFPAFPPCPSFGNPALRPEESDSWDAGLEQHLWSRRVRLAATYFHTDFENLIQSTLIDPDQFCFQARNVGRARTRGVELEASVAPLDGLLLAVAYTYTDAEDQVTGQPLPRVAPDRWAFTGSYELTGRFRVAAEVVVVSSQLEAPGRPRNDGYVVVNGAASYRLPWRWGALSDLTLHLKIQNLFNEDHAEVQGFPALGTHVVAGLRATF